jgi:hypothetical protein
METWSSRVYVWERDAELRVSDATIVTKVAKHEFEIEDQFGLDSV